jgi:hypothetical protein
MFGFLRRRLVGAAVSRGVFGESRFWMVVAVFFGVRFVVRKLGGDGPKTLFSTEIAPGDTFVIGPVSDDA